MEKETAERLAIDGTPHAVRITRAATETISERTIAGTRMREIAKRSGLGLGHLNYYFPSKSILFSTVLESIVEAFYQERREELTDSFTTPVEKIGVFFKQQHDLLLGASDLLTVLYDFWVQGTSDATVSAAVQMNYHRWRGDIERVVAEGVSLGLFSADRAPIAPDLVMSIMEGAVLQYVSEPERLDLDEFFEAAQEMVICWLRP